MGNPKKLPQFLVDEHIPEAGLTVVSVETLGTRVWETQYEVDYDCCHGHDVLSHRRIIRRIENKSKRCRSCASKEGAKKRRRIQGMVLVRVEPTTDQTVPKPEVPREWDPTIPPMMRNLRPWQAIERSAEN